MKTLIALMLMAGVAYGQWIPVSSSPGDFDVGGDLAVGEDLSVVGDLSVNGSAQLGNAATDYHGINTAPVAGQMLTTLFTHDTANETSRGVHNTLNFAGDVSSGSYSVDGFNVDMYLTGNMTGGGGPDRKNAAGFKIAIDDSQVYNGGSSYNELVGVDVEMTDASTKTALGGIQRYGSRVKLLDSLGTLGDTKNYCYYGESQFQADSCYGFYAFIDGGDADNYAFYAGLGDSYFKDTEIDGDLTVDAINFGADAEASDAYVVTLDPAPDGLVTGFMLTFTANTLNTGACTVNVNGLGAKPLKSLHDQDPQDSYIEAGSVVMAVYDGTNFQMIQPDANP